MNLVSVYSVYSRQLNVGSDWVLNLHENDGKSSRNGKRKIILMSPKSWWSKGLSVIWKSPGGLYKSKSWLRVSSLWAFVKFSCKMSIPFGDTKPLWGAIQDQRINISFKLLIAKNAKIHYLEFDNDIRTQKATNTVVIYIVLKFVHSAIDIESKITCAKSVRDVSVFFDSTNFRCDRAIIKVIPTQWTQARSNDLYSIVNVIMCYALLTDMRMKHCHICDMIWWTLKYLDQELSVSKLWIHLHHWCILHQLKCHYTQKWMIYLRTILFNLYEKTQTN